MATWEDVRRIALALPEVVEQPAYGRPAWRTRSKLLVWERPLRPADVAALGDRVPAGPVLGAWVPDLGVKQALLSDEPEVFFTTPHFDGYPAVLVELDRIDVDELAELITDAWRGRAPTRLVARYDADQAAGSA